VDKSPGAGYTERGAPGARGGAMKTLIFLVLMAGGVYLMYNFMQQKKAQAKQDEANAAVQYAKNLKADEDRAQKAVSAYNADVHQHEREMKEADPQ
jgi:Na+-transporting methylmalonyl-CoA/oxaloacetate decarboxylase gamma subunit